MNSDNKKIFRVQFITLSNSDEQLIRKFINLNLRMGIPFKKGQDLIEKNDRDDFRLIFQAEKAPMAILVTIPTEATDISEQYEISIVNLSCGGCLFSVDKKIELKKDGVVKIKMPFIANELILNAQILEEK